ALGKQHTGEHPHLAGDTRFRAAGPGRLARAISRDLTAVRGGRDVIPGNWGNTGHSHRHRDVTPVSREESLTRFAAQTEPGRPAWHVSNGAANSMRTSMANSNPPRPTRWGRIYEAAHPAPPTHSDGYR